LPERNGAFCTQATIPFAANPMQEAREQVGSLNWKGKLSREARATRSNRQPITLHLKQNAFP